jgi:hypothetical protein
LYFREVEIGGSWLLDHLEEKGNGKDFADAAGTRFMSPGTADHKNNH